MFDISDEKYEELRLILEKQDGRACTFEEAKEVGCSLLAFYTSLVEINDRSNEG